MKREKPQKPYPDFPLYSHQNGQWAKKIGGKTRFFGSWSDWRAALAEFEATKGVEPMPDVFDLQDLVNLFLRDKKKSAEAGEIKLDTWKEYDRVCMKALVILGKSTPVEELKSAHFRLLREGLADDIKSPVTLKNTIVKLRVLFAWAYEAEYCEKPLRFRDALKRPPKRLLRASRNQASRKLFSQAEVVAMIEAASPWMKAAVYMGINCGIGNRDICNLPWWALADGWLDFPRPKSEIKRRCFLWPETAAAIEAWRRIAPESQWVFCGERGQQLGQGTSNNTPVAHKFKTLLESCKIEANGRGFYTLRHTYRTVADGAKDLVAVRYTMGHADHSIDDEYREIIEDDRLVAVAEHVRAWLPLRTEECHEV